MRPCVHPDARVHVLAAREYALLKRETMGILLVVILLPHLLGHVLRQEGLGTHREGRVAGQVGPCLQLVAAEDVGTTVTHVEHLGSLLGRLGVLLLLGRLLLRLLLLRLLLLLGRLFLGLILGAIGLLRLSAADLWGLVASLGCGGHALIGISRDLAG